MTNIINSMAKKKRENRPPKKSIFHNYKTKIENSTKASFQEAK